jgi:ProP effector
MNDDLTASEGRGMRMSHAEILAIIELLAETFPNAFAVWERRRRPLKVGIHDDILVKLGGTIAPQELSIALCFYTANAGYLTALRTGTPRVDLDGSPAGTVTESESDFAKVKLAKRRTKWQARRARDPRVICPTVAATVTSP